VHHNVGTKYLIKEIHELARKITEKLDTSDKRKIAFMKQDDIFREKKEKEDRLVKFREGLVVQTKVMLQKYNIIVDKFIEGLVDEFVNRDCNESNINCEFAISIKICERINICYNIMIESTELIKKEYGDKYVNMIKLSPFYKSWIVNYYTTNEAYKQMKLRIDPEYKKEVRKIQLDNTLNELYNSKYVKYAKTTNEYKLYIEHDRSIGDILDVVTNKIERDKRETRIIKNLSKNIGNEFIDIAKTNKQFNTYVEKGGDLSKIVITLKTYVDKHIETEKRKKLINTELEKQGLNELINNESNKIINKYINNKKVLLDETINKVSALELKEKKRIERKKELDTIVIKKFGSNIVSDPIYIKYLNDDTLSLENICADINSIDNMTKNISKEDVRFINTVFIDFKNSTQKTMDLSRNKKETRQYIVYLCNKYEFDFEIHGTMVNIKKKVAEVKKVTEVKKVAEVKKVNITVDKEKNVDEFNYIEKLLKMVNESRKKTDEIMKEYNIIKN